MSVGDSIRKNLHFWHWYPRLLCEGLTEEQIYWQPENHPNHIGFAIWHAYRSEDDILHGIMMGRPSVFSSGDWAERMAVAEPGDPPFGAKLNRKQIAAVRVPLETLFEYADAVAASVQAYADSLSEEDGAKLVELPFFAPVYPTLDTMSRAEMVTFFSVGHTAEHLGEVQYIKGLLGLTGAPF